MKNIFTMNVANGVTEFIKVVTSCPAMVEIDFSASAKVQARIETKNKGIVKKFNAPINKEIKKVFQNGEFCVYDAVKAFESDNRKGMRDSSKKNSDRIAAKKVTAAIVAADNSVADVRASRATKDAIANMRNHGDKDFEIDYQVVGNEVIAEMAKSTGAKVEIGTTVSKVFSNGRMAAYSKVAIVDMLRQVGVTENGVEIYRPQVLKSVAGALFQAELMNRIGDALMAEHAEEKAYKEIDAIEKRLNAIHESAKASWLTFELSKLTGSDAELDDNGFAVFTAPLDEAVAIQFASIIMEVFIDVTGLIEVVKVVGKAKKTGKEFNRYEVRLCDGVMETLRTKVIMDGMGKRTGSVFVGVDVPNVDKHFMLSDSHNVIGDKVGMVVGGNAARYGDASVLVQAINNLQATKLNVDVNFMAVVDDLDFL